MGHGPDNSNCRLVFGVVWFLLLNLNFLFGYTEYDISSVNFKCVTFLAKRSYFIHNQHACVGEYRTFSE